MADKKYGLTKSEMDRIGNLLTIARMQEEILQSITLTYKAFIIESVFKRLGIDEKDFAKSAVDLPNGELLIRDEVKKDEN